MVDVREAPSFIMGIVLAILVAGAGVLVIDGLRDGLADTDGFTVNNETISSASSSTNSTLGTLSVTSLTGVIVSNATEGSPEIASGNYTIKEGALLQSNIERVFFFQLTVGTPWEATDLNITYAGTTFNDQGDILSDGTTSVSNITDQFGTVGTIIGVAIIVGVVVLLFIGFMGRKKNDF